MAKKRQRQAVRSFVPHRINYESRSVSAIASAAKRTRSNERNGHYCSDEEPASIHLAAGWPYSKQLLEPEYDIYVRIFYRRDYLYKKLHMTPIVGDVASRRTKRITNRRPLLSLHRSQALEIFSWPTTSVHISNQELTEANWPKTGILQAVGYRVGDKGLFNNERQKILSRVYEQELPLVESRMYMDEWGSPKSSKRLHKLAYTIAAFVRNAKRKKTDMRRAINQWESDLSWLRDKYYSNMSWNWPSTER